MGDAADDYFDSGFWGADDEPCPSCDGAGVTYSCFEEFACLDPEGGCDLCERRCECQRRPAPAPDKEG